MAARCPNCWSRTARRGRASSSDLAGRVALPSQVRRHHRLRSRGIGYLAAFVLEIVLLTIVITYFWQRAGQATVIATAMHGPSNDSLRLQGELIGDSLRLSILSELTMALPLAFAATFLAAATHGRLGAARGRALRQSAAGYSG